MTRHVHDALGVLAALFAVLALYNGLVPAADGCGMPVRAAFGDDADCREDSGGNVGDALVWALLALPATLAYAATSGRDAGE